MVDGSPRTFRTTRPPQKVTLFSRWFVDKAVERCGYFLLVCAVNGLILTTFRKFADLDGMGMLINDILLLANVSCIGAGLVVFMFFVFYGITKRLII